MSKLVYFKWMVEDAKVLKENLTTEQIGELFIAVMDYLQTGVVQEVSKDIRFPYADYRSKVDRSSANYEETCAKRAESGRKGGTAKARNAANTAGVDSQQAKKFKPPTLKQFKNAVEKIADDNGWDYPNDYDIEAFYDHLNENRWLFEGMPIQSRKDWEAIISERFSDLDNVYYEALRYLISTYPQLHHRWSDIDEITDQLCESWDEKRRTWVIDGRAFQRDDFKAALDLIAGEWIKEIPP